MTTLPKWTRPPYYAGRDWRTWLVAPVNRHRASDILTLSNWSVFTDRLDSLVESTPDLSNDYADLYTGDDCGPFEIVREGCSLVGWVEWIAIHPDAAALIQYAEEASEALEAYPVLDEDHFSDAEYDAAYDAFVDEADDFRERLAGNLIKLAPILEPLSADDLWTLYSAADLSEPYTSDNGGTYVFIEHAADSLTAADVTAALAPTH